MTAAERRLVPAPCSTAEVVEDTLLLLRKGRVEIALRQLEKLPEMLRDELTDAIGTASWDAYVRGFERGRQALAAEIVAHEQPVHEVLGAEQPAQNLAASRGCSPETSRCREAPACPPTVRSFAPARTSRRREVPASQPQIETSRRHEVPASRAQRPCDVTWLRAQVEDPVRRQRVLALLKFDDAALAAVLEGRAQLSSGQWKRLREALGP